MNKEENLCTLGVGKEFLSSYEYNPLRIKKEMYFINIKISFSSKDKNS